MGGAAPIGIAGPTGAAGRATVGTNTPSRRESVGGLVKLPGLSSMLRRWVRSASEPTAGQAVTAISGCRRHSGSIQIKCRSLAGIRSATVRILHPSGVFSGTVISTGDVRPIN